MTKKRKNAVIATAMVAVLAIAGIAAYFTATDSQMNTFTVGNIEIDQHEDAWDIINNLDNPDADLDQDGKLDTLTVTPNREYVKDPVVTNKGENDAYVFTMVAVPKKSVKVARTDTGEVLGPQVTQLYQLNEWGGDTYANASNNTVKALAGNNGAGSVDKKQLADNVSTDSVYNSVPVTSGAAAPQPTPLVNMSNDADQWTGVDTFNDDDWFLLAVNPAMGSSQALSQFSGKYNIYLFAYAKNNSDGGEGSTATLTTLKGKSASAQGSGQTATTASEGATTSPVFRSVTFANIVNINDTAYLQNDPTNEDSIDYDAELEGTVPQILVKSFVIQADNVTAGDSADAATVWGILNTQDGAYAAFADELEDSAAQDADWQATAH